MRALLIGLLLAVSLSSQAPSDNGASMTAERTFSFMTIWATDSPMVTLQFLHRPKIPGEVAATYRESSDRNPNYINEILAMPGVREVFVVRKPMLAVTVSLESERRFSENFTEQVAVIVWRTFAQSETLQAIVIPLQYN